MALAIGPCMFVAPLVPIVALLLLPIWVAALIVSAAAWLLVWPVGRLLALLGMTAGARVAAAMTRWLRKVATPWSIFDPPRRRAAPPPPPDGGAA